MGCRGVVPGVRLLILLGVEHTISVQNEREVSVTMPQPLAFLTTAALRCCVLRAGTSKEEQLHVLRNVRKQMRLQWLGLPAGVGRSASGIGRSASGLADLR